MDPLLMGWLVVSEPREEAKEEGIEEKLGNKRS